MHFCRQFELQKLSKLEICVGLSTKLGLRSTCRDGDLVSGIDGGSARGRSCSQSACVGRAGGKWSRRKEVCRNSAAAGAQTPAPVGSAAAASPLRLAAFCHHFRDLPIRYTQNNSG